MGIFDVIELKQHINAIGEYIFYLSDVAAQTAENNKDYLLISLFDLNSSFCFMREHLKQMSDVLAKYDSD